MELVSGSRGEAVADLTWAIMRVDADRVGSWTELPAAGGPAKVTLGSWVSVDEAAQNPAQSHPWDCWAGSAPLAQPSGSRLISAATFAASNSK